MVTTSTQYGRSKIYVPDLSHDPGTALHQKVTGAFADKYGIKTISDYLSSTYYPFSSVSNGNSVTVTHNYGLPLSNLTVLFFNGVSFYSQIQVNTLFTVSQIDFNAISITNSSGSTQNFEVMVIAYPVATFLADVLQLKSGTSKGVDVATSGILSVGKTNATKIEIANSGITTDLGGALSMSLLTDSTTTGSLATLPAPVKSFVKVTNASLSSIEMVVASGINTLFILTNKTGSNITIKNLSGVTAANQIITGTGADSVLVNNASFIFIYDTAASKWIVISGVPNIIGPYLGSNTSSLIPANYVGQILRSSVALNTTFSINSNQAGDAVSLALTQGTWEVSGYLVITTTGAGYSTFRLLTWLSGDTGNNVSNAIITNGLQDNILGSIPTTFTNVILPTLVRYDGTDLIFPGHVSSAVNTVNLKASSGSYTSFPVYGGVLIARRLN